MRSRSISAPALRLILGSVARASAPDVLSETEVAAADGTFAGAVSATAVAAWASPVILRLRSASKGEKAGLAGSRVRGGAAGAAARGADDCGRGEADAEGAVPEETGSLLRSSST